MYTITFEDGTIFQGGNPINSRWNEMEDKKIKSLEYKFGTQLLALQGYEEYNHLPYNENVLGMVARVPGLFLMGKIGEQVDRFYLNFKNGRIYHSTAKAGHEYQNRAVTGWKKGLEKPTIKSWQIL